MGVWDCGIVGFFFFFNRWNQIVFFFIHSVFCTPAYPAFNEHNSFCWLILAGCERKITKSCPSFHILPLLPWYCCSWMILILEKKIQKYSQPLHKNGRHLQTFYYYSIYWRAFSLKFIFHSNVIITIILNQFCNLGFKFQWNRAGCTLDTRRDYVLPVVYFV